MSDRSEIVGGAGCLLVLVAFVVGGAVANGRRDLPAFSYVGITLGILLFVMAQFIGRKQRTKRDGAAASVSGSSECPLAASEESSAGVGMEQVHARSNPATVPSVVDKIVEGVMNLPSTDTHKWTTRSAALYGPMYPGETMWEEKCAKAEDIVAKIIGFHPFLKPSWHAEGGAVVIEFNHEGSGTLAHRYVILRAGSSMYFGYQSWAE